MDVATRLESAADRGVTAIWCQGIEDCIRYERELTVATAAPGASEALRTLSPSNLALLKPDVSLEVLRYASRAGDDLVRRLKTVGGVLGKFGAVLEDERLPATLNTLQMAADVAACVAASAPFRRHGVPSTRGRGQCACNRGCRYQGGAPS